MAPRLIIAVIGGRIVVRDRRRPDAALVEVSLAGGDTAAVATHLCGWLPDADEPLWETPAQAQEALSDIAGDEWSATLRDAAELAEPAPALLPPAEDAQLVAVRHRHPGAWTDGPHPDDEGGWHVTVAGASDLDWIVGRGPTPRDAARDALAQIARRERGAEEIP